MSVNNSGIIIPEIEDINAAIVQLLTDLQDNDSINARFRSNPIEYFKSIGIPSDAVFEVMNDLHLASEIIDTTICGLMTCVFTKCVLTNSANQIVLKASVTQV